MSAPSVLRIERGARVGRFHRGAAVLRRGNEWRATGTPATGGRLAALAAETISTTQVFPGQLMAKLATSPKADAANALFPEADLERFDVQVRSASSFLSLVVSA
jgi:hypothetical protein